MIFGAKGHFFRGKQAVSFQGKYILDKFGSYTVDGRNPAPPGVWNPVNNGIDYLSTG